MPISRRVPTLVWRPRPKNLVVASTRREGKDSLEDSAEAKLLINLSKLFINGPFTHGAPFPSACLPLQLGCT